jgi:hypothetical protein
MRYVAHQKPEFLALASRVLAIPSKRYSALWSAISPRSRPKPFWRLPIRTP